MKLENNQRHKNIVLFLVSKLGKTPGNNPSNGIPRFLYG